MMNVRLFLFLFIFLDGCIDPLVLDVSKSRVLVVDGMITDQAGPCTVILYYSNPIGKEIYAPDKATNCIVTIESDAGESEKLKESAPGIYKTISLQGVVGRSYTLKIITPEGLSYESVPEEILPVGDIKELYYEFIKAENPVKTDYLDTKNGFKLLVDSEILPNQEAHLRWRWHGIYEILTYPQFRTRLATSRNGQIIQVPDPPPCTLNNNCGCCTCCTCWVSTRDELIHLSEQKILGNAGVTGQPVGFVPATRRLFYNKYKIEVEQLSVTPTVYEYWKRIEAQSSSGSDLFQTPPPNTVGNIISITEGAPQAFGIFSASSVKSKMITLNRADVPYTLPQVDTIKQSCLITFFHSTNIKPPNW